MMIKGMEDKVGGTWTARSEEDLNKRVLPMLEKRYDNSEYEFVDAKPGNNGCINIRFKYRGFVPWKCRVKVVKRAKKLHTRPVDPRIKKLIMARLSSEMTNLRIESEINKAKEAK